MGRAAAAWTCLASVVVGICAVAAAGADPARLAMIAVPGRTSLVFPAGVSLTAERPVLRDGRTVLVSATTKEPCAPTRYTSADPRSAVATVIIRCGREGAFDAVVILREPVSASLRRSPGRVYLDLTALSAATGEAPASHAHADTHTSGTPGDVPAREAPALTADLEALYARASKLAAAGDVRRLSALIGSLPSARREDEHVVDRLDALMNIARERRLELDRELFAGAAKGTPP